MRRFSRSRASAPDPLDLRLEVRDEAFVHLDHFCHAAEMRRLLGVALTADERIRLRNGESVAIPLACDRCIWERRLVLRLRP